MYVHDRNHNNVKMEQERSVHDHHQRKRERQMQRMVGHDGWTLGFNKKSRKYSNTWVCSSRFRIKSSVSNIKERHSWIE